jgi:uncharacterized membrane protein
MNIMKNKKLFYSTKWIAYTALLTALVIATSFITPVPIAPFGNLYWCDGVIFVAAYLMDPLSSFIIGGIGTFLYDVIHGNASMMFVSLIIHGVQAALTSAIFHYVFGNKFFKEKLSKLEPVWAFIASLFGAVVVIGGYFISRYYINGYALETCLYKSVANVIQEVVGIAVAMIVCYATTFKQQLAKNHLLPDFKKEVIDSNKKSQPAQAA